MLADFSESGSLNSSPLGYAAHTVWVVDGKNVLPFSCSAAGSKKLPLELFGL